MLRLSTISLPAVAAVALFATASSGQPSQPQQPPQPPASTPPAPPPPPTASDAAPGGNEDNHPLVGYGAEAFIRHSAAIDCGNAAAADAEMAKLRYAIDELRKRLRAARKAGQFSAVKPEDVQRQINLLESFQRAAERRRPPTACPPPSTPQVREAQSVIDQIEAIERFERERRKAERERQSSGQQSMQQSSLNLPPWARDMLTAHNAARAAVGAPPLQWNPVLQEHATARAGELAQLRQLTHAPREGRGTERENILQAPLSYSPAQMIGRWTRESSNFVPGLFPDVSKTGNWMDVAHYTQVIWPQTTEIGCGYAPGGGFNWLVCRYNPGGNKDGKPVIAQNLDGAGPLTLNKYNPAVAIAMTESSTSNLKNSTNARSGGNDRPKTKTDPLVLSREPLQPVIGYAPANGAMVSSNEMQGPKSEAYAPTNVDKPDVTAVNSSGLATFDFGDFDFDGSESYAPTTVAKPDLTAKCQVSEATRPTVDSTSNLDDFADYTRVYRSAMRSGNTAVANAALQGMSAALLKQRSLVEAFHETGSANSRESREAGTTLIGMERVWSDLGLGSPSAAPGACPAASAQSSDTSIESPPLPTKEGFVPPEPKPGEIDPM